MSDSAADANTPPALLSPLIRALLLYVLLVAGVAMWLQFGAIEWAYDAQLWGLIAFAALAMIPFLARPLGELLNRMRRLPPRARPAVALGVFLASACTLCYFNFHREQSDLAPSVCDEYSYLIQAQLVAHGRLWSRAHEHAEFFTTFQLVGAPVYSSIYFPGTALWIAPWSMIDPAGLCAWIGPWLAASLAVMLVYLITAELLDDLAGLLAALLTFAVPIWRGLAMVIMGQVIAAMLGLLVIWIFLRWRKAATAERLPLALLWGGAAAFFACWAVLTRPVDGLAYSLPVVAGVLLGRGIKPKIRALSLAAAVAGMIPLGALQLGFNKAVSGSLLRTPFSWYNDKYLPGTSYGAQSRDHERMRQIDHTAHFHHSYQQFTRPFVEMIGTNSLPDLLHERFRMTTVAGSTHGMTLIFAPFALLLLLPRRGLTAGGANVDEPARRIGGWEAWLLAAPFPLMILLYLPYGFYLYQYAGAAIPTLAFWLVAGAWALGGFLSEPAAGPGPALSTAKRWLSIIAMSLGAIAVMAVAFGEFVYTTSLLAVIGPACVLISGACVWPRQVRQSHNWWHHGLFVFSVGALLALGTRGIPGFYPTQSEDWYRVPELRQIDQILGDIPSRALVFVSPPGGDAPPEAEAVYNLGVVFPDEARVIRAHDLGKRNVELLAYCAAKDPERGVYHYHRRTRVLTELGTAAELHSRPLESLQDLFSELSLPWRLHYTPMLIQSGYDLSELPFEPPTEPQLEAAQERQD